MIFKKSYKFFKQLDYMDCGPTCLKMIAAFYGRIFSLEYLRSISALTKKGANFLGISDAAEEIGLETTGMSLTLEQLKRLQSPCILHWNRRHFVVLFEVKVPFIKRLFNREDYTFIIGDPSHGLVKVNERVFSESWISSAEQKGIVLTFKPTESFYSADNADTPSNKSPKFLINYLKPYKKYLFQVFISMVLSSLISLTLPFLTQSLVDSGIKEKSISFIYLILASQLLLFLGSTAIDLIRTWIILHINARVNIQIIANFLLKLMRLPLHFFESKNVGDITQRINDHTQIENFITGSTLNVLFSFVNLIIFSFVLFYYNVDILLVFIAGSVMSVVWVVFFLKKRKELNFIRFQQQRENQNNIYDIINGMQEIKLNNGENIRQQKWKNIQLSLFVTNTKNLSLEQWQESGSNVITQLKNICISSLSAIAVVNGNITLGMMLSISYIVGQMNSPLMQLISFVRSIQDAKISFERLSEVHNKPDEESEQYGLKDVSVLNNYMGTEPGIALTDLTFKYGSARSKTILNNVSIEIPEGKVTAIVGSSGSGKTTIMKLLLKFYSSYSGDISVNGTSLSQLSAKKWRSLCGTVMQDGLIFSDSIAKNIATDTEDYDPFLMAQALKISNIGEFVEGLPLGLETPIGSAGVGLSGGQRQRILIARAVYKNPQYLFFDEATSALDANNERIIMDNLQGFFKHRTVVIIAHRLSTVMNADQIIVLEDGEVIEVGSHKVLTLQRGRYYELVKNQLDLETLYAK
jgi:ATP-binding cassette subfamily B protein